MFAYRLKTNDTKERRTVENIKLSKFEWYCQIDKNIKLENNSLVECREFKGYQIPKDLIDYIENEKKVKPSIIETKEVDEELEEVTKSIKKEKK